MSDLAYSTQTFTPFLIFAVYLITFLAVFALLLAVYLLTAIPMFKLAKKHGFSRPWFAFVPFVSTWLFAAISGEKPLFLLGDNVVIKDRFVSAVICILSAYIFTPISHLMHYAYLRDLLYLYEADQKKARNTAMIISLVDLLLTSGLARAVLLITLVRKTPAFAAADNPPIPEKAFVF